MTGSPDPIPAAVLARFTSAEARLYPMAMTDPDGYERAVTLVGMVANELRQQCADLAVRARASQRADRCTSRAGGRERSRARWTAAGRNSRRGLRLALSRAAGPRLIVARRARSLDADTGACLY